MVQFSNYKEIGEHNRKPAPIRLGVGNRNIRITAKGSAAELGRQMNAAFSTLAKDLAWYFRQIEDALPEDMMAAMGPTMQLADVYCPKDSGDMVNSGYLAVEKFRNNVRVEAGYGRGGFPWYTVYVHEMTLNKHQEPTRAKWFQQAIDEDYYAIIQRLTDNVAARSGLR